MLLDQSPELTGAEASSVHNSMQWLLVLDHCYTRINRAVLKLIYRQPWLTTTTLKAA
jgi:hypothetical protein